jgi:hypothetical protein
MYRLLQFGKGPVDLGKGLGWTAFVVDQPGWGLGGAESDG